MMLESPVPPFAIAAMPVMLPAVPPMFKVEVESAVGDAAPPVAFPRMVLAAWVASLVRAMPPVASVRVEFAPPTKVPRVPPIVNSALGVKVVVATFANVLTPLKYGMLPTTAGVEVASPPHVMFGVVPPEEIIGHVPVTAVTVPPPPVEVATQPMPLVVLFQPRTYPPAGATP